MRSKHFGGKIKKEHLALYEQSPNWKDGQFQNLEETTLSMSLYKIPGLIYKQLKGRKDRDPQKKGFGVLIKVDRAEDLDGAPLNLP